MTQGTMIAKLQVRASDLDHHLSRWHSKLYRAVNMIRSLELAKRRNAKKLAELEALLKKPKPKVAVAFNDTIDAV